MAVGAFSYIGKHFSLQLAFCSIFQRVSPQLTLLRFIFIPPFTSWQRYLQGMFALYSVLLHKALAAPIMALYLSKLRAKPASGRDGVA